MRLIFTLALLAVGLAGHAEEINKSGLLKPIHEQTVTNLLPDLAEILGEPLPDERPVVTLASRDEIQRAYCIEGAACGVAAITNRDTGEIVLHEGFMPNSLFSVSILFHEMVHWVQVKRKKYRDLPDCERWATMEMEAYTAQAQFLRKHGHRGFEVPNLMHQCQPSH